MLCYQQRYWTLQVGSESLSWGLKNPNNNGGNIFTGRRESTMRSSLLSLGVLSTISVLENHGIQRGSSTWQPLLFRARSPRTGKLWGVRSREAIHATCVTMHLLGEGLSLLMAGKRNGCGTHWGRGGWGADGGQLFTPRFISWDLLFRLAPLTPWGWRGIPPTYSSPAEERMRLLSLA